MSVARIGASEPDFLAGNSGKNHRFLRHQGDPTFQIAGLAQLSLPDGKIDELLNLF